LDPEADLRALLKRALMPFFQVWEEVPMTAKSGHKVRADLLFVNKRYESSFAIAIEIKSQPPKQPKNYRDTFLQALRYVDADINDKRVPECPVNFAMVYQPRKRWLPHVSRSELVTPEIVDSITMDALELAFNSLRVGYIVYKNGNLTLKLSHNELWSSKNGWSVEAQRRNI